MSSEEPLITKNENQSLSPPSTNKEFEDPYNILTINLDALKSNYRFLKSKIPEDKTLYAVLKADAYGHSISETGKVLSEIGCKHFAVESPKEGIELRNQGITGEILLMNPIPSWMAELSVRHDLSVSVIQPSIIPQLEAASKSVGKICKIHLNINVGLNRLGISPSKIIKIAQEASIQPHLKLIGMFGQPREPSAAKDSFQRLRSIFDELKSKNLAPDTLHFANSTTLLSHPETVGDGVRIGILLFGVLPPEQFSEGEWQLPLKPVMSLKTEIVQILDIPKGSKIGYRSKEKTKRDSIIGTIAIGYSHGLDRKYAKDGFVLLHGRRVPFIGPISMNAATIDITEFDDVKIGDEVVVLGKQGDEEIEINELAIKSGTIGAELMSRFGKSLTRKYEYTEEELATEITIEQNSSEDIYINYYETEKELPRWLNLFDIVEFLSKHMVPYDDPQEIISKAVESSISYESTGGFILLATEGQKLIGCIVCVQTDTIGIIPENILVYVCVHSDHRRKRIGQRLVKEAVDCANGNVKLHVERPNPAIKLYKKLGFSDKYLEMRFMKGED